MDKLQSYNGNSITYDSIGNPLNDGTYSYTWANGRQLSTMTGPKNMSFKYNAAGLRTEKREGNVTTTYRWVGDQVTAETTGNETILYYYDAQGKLVSFRIGTNDYYYVRNGQGDITGILNSAGAQVHLRLVDLSEANRTPRNFVGCPVLVISG